MFLTLRCVFENIRTDFINGLGGRKGKDQPPFRPPRLEAEAKRTISSFSLAANFQSGTNK